MRWFKHLTLAHDDTAIAVVLELFGPEGYGIYWLMLEHVAAGIEKNSVLIPSRTHSAVEWSKICACSARRLRQFCEKATELRLICAQTAPDLRRFSSRRVADRLQIDIPKLLKYRDEYSKKSGQTPVQDREQIQIQRENKVEPPSPPSPKNGSGRVPRRNLLRSQRTPPRMAGVDGEGTALATRESRGHLPRVRGLLAGETGSCWQEVRLAGDLA